METINRNSGKRYRESITISGRTIKSPVFARKTDCRQWLADQRSKKHETILYGDAFKLREKLTLADFSLRWIDGKKAAGLSPSSVDNYERYLRVHILPSIGQRDLKQITKQDFERLQVELVKTHNAKGVNIILAVLKSILMAAINEGYILRNPTLGIKTLTEGEPVDAYWSKSEIDQFLLGNINNPSYDLYLIALNTGMRKGELAGLKWDRVDFSLKQITISRTRDVDGLKERTKTKLKRVLPMNQLVKMTLLKIFKARTGGDFVFVKPDNSPIDVHHIYRDFSKAQKAAQISNKIRFHDLRHTFASQFMMNDGNVFDLQKLLGHTDIKMTMRYAHYSQEHLQQAMEGFELGHSSASAQNPPMAMKYRSELDGSLVKMHG